jgi:peroxiredoxin
LNNIKKIYYDTKGKYKFVAVSLRKENLDKYIEDNSLPFEVYNSPSKDIFKAFRMGKTPQTYVISKDGFIITNWSGMYVGEQKATIASFFGTDLGN